MDVANARLGLTAETVKPVFPEILGFGDRRRDRVGVNMRLEGRVECRVKKGDRPCSWKEIVAGGDDIQGAIVMPGK